MRAAVLWASEASTNLGVRALARGSRDLLRRVDPDVEVEFVDFGHRPAELRFGRPRSLVRERLFNEHGMMRWLRGFDLIWDTRSGDSFADIYGPDRHWKMSLLHEFAAQAGVPTVLAPQTIGPFHSATGRRLARRNLRRSALAYARDPASVEAARDLGRPVDRLASDLVFGIDQPAPGESPDVLFNVSGLLLQPNSHLDHVAYAPSSTARSTACSQRDATWRCFPTCLTPPAPITTCRSHGAREGVRGTIAAECPATSTTCGR